MAKCKDGERKYICNENIKDNCGIIVTKHI